MSVNTSQSVSRRRFSPKLAFGVVGIVLLEGLLILGGVFAAEPASRACDDAGSDARVIFADSSLAQGFEVAWSVPVHLASGGRLIAIELAEGRMYFWTDVAGRLDSDSTVLGFGDDTAGHPKAGDQDSPVRVSAGEIMFDAQRPLDQCFITPQSL